MDCNTAVKGVVTELAVEDRRLAEFELRSPAKLQHLEASKVIGCDWGLHSRPELSELVSRD